MTTMATTNRAQRRREQFGSHRNAKASGWPISAANPVFHAHDATGEPKGDHAEPEKKTETKPPTEPPSPGQEAATVDQ